MPTSSLLLLTPPQIEFLGGSVLVLMLLRWVHTIAGILWVGLLYYLNLVSIPFLNELDPKTRIAVVPKLMPRALWWFRWSSVVTVLAGIAYWMHIVGTDVRNAVAAGQAASGFMLTGSFFGIWTVAFAVEMGILVAPADFLRRGPVLGILVTLIVISASYVFLGLNQHGWETNRALTIGIGGGLGWFMMMNVWGIVWRMHKKMIRWTEAVARGDAMPPEYAKTARLALLTARVNFWLSFPMLFLMGAASHYILFASQ
jgi:uncharacterized membrane protein